MASINEPPGSTIGSNIEGGSGGATAPAITALDPDFAVIGDASFTIFVHGTGFLASSVIVFAGQQEPTTLEEDGTLSTGVNMDVWHGPDTVKVSVKNGTASSNELDFTFDEAPVSTRKASAPKRKR